MGNNTINKLIEKDTINSITSLLKRIIFFDQTKKAFEFSQLLDKILVKINKDKNFPKSIYDSYFKYNIKLKFIALPLLNNAEVIDLIKKYFNWFFRIDGYSLAQKFKQKLINIEVYEDRDKFKQEVKNMLLDNNLQISRKTEIKSIKEWLNDYNVKVGTGTVDVLKRRQYITNLYSVPRIDKKLINKLIILFEFYDSLKLSSLSPEGHEEEVPIKINGKLYLFQGGKLVPIDGESSSYGKITGPPRTEEEKRIDDLKTEEKKYSRGGLEERAIEEEINQEKRIEELRIEANKYQAGSLERRAIEEEIKKLEN